MIKTAARPKLLAINGGFDLSAEALLFLLYLPTNSVSSKDPFNNRTMQRVLKPVIGSSICIVQMLHAGYHSNDVDLQLLEQISTDSNHFIVRNHAGRVQTTMEIRKLLQAPMGGWIGGKIARLR